MCKILPNNNPPQLQCRLALGSWRGAPRVGVGAGMWPELPPELLHHIIRCGQANGLDFLDCLAAVCTCAAWQQALQPLARAEKIGWLRLEKPTARIRALFLTLAADAFPQLRSLRLLSADGVDYRLHVQWLRREAVRSPSHSLLDISAHLKPARLNKDALAVRTIAMFAASACAVPGSQVAQIKLGPTWGFDGLYGTVDVPSRSATAVYCNQSNENVGMLGLTLISECIIAAGAPCLGIELQTADINSDALTAFSDAVRCDGLASLKLLDLKFNQIGPAGAKALAEAMWTGSGNGLIRYSGGSRLPSLEDLNLGHNALGDKGAVALALAFRRGAAPWLKSLWLDVNKIGDRGMAALSTAVQSLPFLCELGLDCNNYGHAGSAALRLMLAAAGVLTNLRKLTVGGTQRSCCDFHLSAAEAGGTGTGCFQEAVREAERGPAPLCGYPRIECFLESDRRQLLRESFSHTREASASLYT